MVITMCFYYLVTLSTLRLIFRCFLYLFSVLYALEKNTLLEDDLLTNFLLS